MQLRPAGYQASETGSDLEPREPHELPERSTHTGGSTVPTTHATSETSHTTTATSHGLEATQPSQSVPEFWAPKERFPDIEDFPTFHDLLRASVNQDGFTFSLLGKKVGEVQPDMNPTYPNVKEAVKGREVDGYGYIQDMAGNIVAYARRSVCSIIDNVLH